MKTKSLWKNRKKRKEEKIKERERERWGQTNWDINSINDKAKELPNKFPKFGLKIYFKLKKKEKSESSEIINMQPEAKNSIW